MPRPRKAGNVLASDLHRLAFQLGTAARKTIRYYAGSVNFPGNIYVAGIGATLLPEFIREQIGCTIIEGKIEKPSVLGDDSVPVHRVLTPDLCHAG